MGLHDGADGGLGREGAGVGGVPERVAETGVLAWIREEGVLGLGGSDELGGRGGGAEREKGIWEGGIC